MMVLKGLISFAVWILFQSILLHVVNADVAKSSLPSRAVDGVKIEDDNQFKNVNSSLQVDVELDQKCDFVKKQPRLSEKRYAPGDKSEFTSTWIERQYVFRVETGRAINGFWSGTVRWHINNRIRHTVSPHWTRTYFDGGCSYGEPFGPESARQMKPGTKPLYRMDPPTEWTPAPDGMHRGKLIKASAKVTQWFAWYTSQGKFSVELNFVETYNLPDTDVVTDGWKYRTVSEPMCILHFRELGNEPHHTHLPPQNWKVYMHSLQYDGPHRKREQSSLLVCTNKI